MKSVKNGFVQSHINPALYPMFTFKKNLSNAPQNNLTDGHLPVFMILICFTS